MCFLGGWPTLGRESEIAGDGFGVDALRLNHFDGLVRNCVNPDEGETERGIPAPAALFGARASCGLSELGGLARRGAINGCCCVSAGENEGRGGRCMLVVPLLLQCRLCATGKAENKVLERGHVLAMTIS